MKVVAGHDFHNGDTDPMDDHSHGTHVASTVAGNDPNGLKGVAPDAEIVAVKVLGADGSGNLYLLLEAYDYVIDLNNNSIPFENEDDYVDIVSLSLGGTGNSPDNEISWATDDLISEGVLAVIAAGNSGPDKYTIGTPGSSRDALTVGASGNNYGREGILFVDDVEIPSTGGLHSALGEVSGPIYDADYGLDFSTVPSDSIAVARRGFTTFNEMVIRAENYGIKGLIIVNNVPGDFLPLVYMNSSVHVVTVGSEYGETILSATSASINISRSPDWANEVASSLK